MGNYSWKRFREFILSPSHYRTVSILSVLVIAAAIPLTVFIAQQKQLFRQNAASIVGPSGEAMPVGDLLGWKQIFTDDFTTDVPVGGFSGCSNSKSPCSGLPASVGAKWWAYPDGWQDTSKNGTYTPSKVISIGSDVMNLYLHTENGVHMVSAPVPRLPGAVGSEGGLQYGRYAIRFKADPVPGYKTAWLLWPDSEVWPRDGEIDFPEGGLNGTIDGFMHWQGGTSGNSQDAYSTNSTYTSWHTAVTEWTPTSLTFYLDGQLVGRSTNTSHIPNTPMHWVIQTETSLDGTPPSDTAAGNVQIDWAAVWSYAPGLVPGTPTPTPPTNPSPTPVTSQSPIKHVIVISMENHDWADIKGSSSAPYLNGLLTRPDASYASNYRQPTGLHPSEPNYIWLEGGTNAYPDHTFTTDDDPSSSNSTSSTKHLATYLNSAGLNWRGYMESKPSGCALSSSGSYTVHHNPYAFFQDIVGNPPNNSNGGNCNNIVDFSNFSTDLANNTIANYNFVTPNKCNDMHDSCSPTNNSILQADNWLKTNLTTILNSQSYKSGDTAVFIVWDEADDLSGNDNDLPIGMIAVYPKTKGNGYTNNISYDHSSFVKTIQNIFNLSPYLGKAGSATDLSDLFQSGVIPSLVTTTPSVTPTKTPTPTLALTPTPTTKPTSTPTPTQKPTPTISPTNSPTPTLKPSQTPTITQTPTNTPTSTPKPTPTSTPIPTPTPTIQPPTGQFVIAKDTFSGRSVSGGWGTASDGNTWALQVGSASLLSVGNSSAVIKGSDSSVVNYLTLGNQTASDEEVLVRFSTGSYNDDDARAILRFSNASNYYTAGIASPNGFPELDIYKMQNGNRYLLSSTVFPATNNTYYWQRVRVRASGASSALIAVKVWQDGTTEPSNWDLIYTDYSPLPLGKVGINGWDGGVGWKIDSFSAYNLSATPPTPSPTPTRIPSSPTPTQTLTPTPIIVHGDGLLGMYYTNENLSGTPIYRIDPAINFNWKHGSPMRGIPNDSFSTRWTGYVMPQKSETYTFYTTVDDGVRVWVDGNLLIDAWGLHSSATFAGNISLLANHKYTLKIEYFEHHVDASINLKWSSPSTPTSIIPQSQLYTFN